VKETLSCPSIQFGLHHEFITTPLESADPRALSRNCFIIRTYKTPPNLRILKDLQASKFSSISFISHTYTPPLDVRETKDL
jgi:hypothetical protein